LRRAGKSDTVFAPTLRISGAQLRPLPYCAGLSADLLASCNRKHVHVSRPVKSTRVHGELKASDECVFSPGLKEETESGGCDEVDNQWKLSPQADIDLDHEFGFALCLGTAR
jgi:hypothetical protein